MEGQVALLWVFIEMTSRFQNPDANQTNGNLSQSTSGYVVLRFPQTGEPYLVPYSAHINPGCCVRPLPGNHLFCFAMFLKTVFILPSERLPPPATRCLSLLISTHASL